MTQNADELYLTAEAEYKNGNYTEALRLYFEVLNEEPDCAPAHNSIGWIYKTQFDDYPKAERHYHAAISANPMYPHAYWSLTYLLTDLERFAEVEQLMKRCEQIPSVDKSMIQQRLGIIAELKGDFQQAVNCYKKSLLLTISDERVDEMRKNIERCEYKISLN